MRLRASLALLLTLGACAGGPELATGPAKIGRPYSVNGVTYVPRDDLGYDRTGLASWYGRDHDGKRTANGERFDRRMLSAAHPTLPLPSFVEVMALKSGRKVVVRLNDRGPFARGRIIDLSQAAAAAIGLERDGVGPVRVRRVFPDARAQAALLKGRRIDVPAIVATSAAPPRPASGDFIEVAALADADSAAYLAGVLGGSVVSDGVGARVRLGPFASPEAASEALARVRRDGYPEAVIVSGEAAGRDSQTPEQDNRAR